MPTVRVPPAPPDADDTLCVLPCALYARLPASHLAYLLAPLPASDSAADYELALAVDATLPHDRRRPGPGRASSAIPHSAAAAAAAAWHYRPGSSPSASSGSQRRDGIFFIRKGSGFIDTASARRFNAKAPKVCPK